MRPIGLAQMAARGPMATRVAQGNTAGRRRGLGPLPRTYMAVRDRAGAGRKQMDKCTCGNGPTLDACPRSSEWSAQATKVRRRVDIRMAADAKRARKQPTGEDRQGERARRGALPTRPDERAESTPGGERRRGLSSGDSEGTIQRALRPKEPDPSAGAWPNAGGRPISLRSDPPPRPRTEMRAAKSCASASRSNSRR
jgi:hypothetical protein